MKTKNVAFLFGRKNGSVDGNTISLRKHKRNL